jgi:phage pi2 protein 07
MNTFRITIASPPDREQLVAEVLFGNEQVAELNTERGTLAIELYPRADGQAWSFDADQFQSALAQAKAKLLGRHQ